MFSPFLLKKLSILFGGFRKTLYLCTRFRKGSEFFKSWCGSSAG